MDADKKTDGKEIKPGGKFVILRDATHWDPEIDDFVLSESRAGSNRYAATSGLSQDLLKRIDRAVRLEVLDYTDEPDKYTPPASESRSTESRPRFHWNELKRQDVKDNKLMPKAPQISNRTLAYPDPNGVSARLLILTAKEFSQRLPGVLAGRTKPEQVSILNDLLKHETSGMNPSFASRRQVVDAINERLVDLGVKNAILTGVRSVPDPDSDPNKRSRIAL